MRKKLLSVIFGTALAANSLSGCFEDEPEPAPKPAPLASKHSISRELPDLVMELGKKSYNDSYEVVPENCNFGVYYRPNDSGGIIKIIVGTEDTIYRYFDKHADGNLEFRTEQDSEEANKWLQIGRVDPEDRYRQHKELVPQMRLLYQGEYQKVCHSILKILRQINSDPEKKAKLKLKQAGL